MPVSRRRPTLTAVLSDFPPSLRQLLRSDCTWDDEQTAALWASYLETRSAADEQSLIDHYTPSVAKWVQAAVRNRPGGFPDPLEDYISDGLLGLLKFIRRNTFFKLGLTAYQVRRAIVKAVWDEARNRSWAGKGRTTRMRTIELIRASLVSANGTMPTRDQIVERLHQQVTNPNYYFSSIDAVERFAQPRSQLSDDEDRAVQERVDIDAVQPIDAVMTDEVRDLAMKGLKGKDRQIFRLMLVGHGCHTIARKMGLATTSVVNRLNGVLWEARCRADLAKYFGVEPAKEKIRRPDGEFVSMSQVPPARLAG